MEAINKRIQAEICQKTLISLSDESLINEYKNCKSVVKEIDKLNRILSKYVSKDIQDNIINDYLLELIPAGTKGVIRGNKFNKIVMNHILDMNLNSELEIKFEEKSTQYSTDEIPDWYIYDKISNRIIIGMNQLDLWNGGQQMNRGFKYLKNENTNSSKLVCVVCNEIKFKSTKNKAFQLFQIGFKNDTLCYLNGLNKIINDFFMVPTTSPNITVLDITAPKLD
jgi:hypothetical protein